MPGRMPSWDVAGWLPEEAFASHGELGVGGSFGGNEWEGVCNAAQRLFNMMELPMSWNVS